MSRNRNVRNRTPSQAELNLQLQQLLMHHNEVINSLQDEAAESRKNILILSKILRKVRQQQDVVVDTLTAMIAVDEGKNVSEGDAPTLTVPGDETNLLVVPVVDAEIVRL